MGAFSGNFSCDGTDDGRTACPAHSIAYNLIYSSGCLCDVGYGAVFSNKNSELHECIRCLDSLGLASKTFKDFVSNADCASCSVCNQRAIYLYK